MLKSTYGAYEQMESSAVLSAEPLCSYAQMTSAKLVIELPSAENVCVDHRRRNGLIPCAWIYPKASGKI